MPYDPNAPPTPATGSGGFVKSVIPTNCQLLKQPLQPLRERIVFRKNPRVHRRRLDDCTWDMATQNPSDPGVQNDGVSSLVRLLSPKLPPLHLPSISAACKARGSNPRQK